jgi:1-deoxy-D-xylulose-5-phosphate synthase
MSVYPLLDTVNSPAELRLLERKQLPQLAQELREFLIESVSKTGGHLSSNLGTVELTIALHYVFNTPEDRLVWDVGHQTYAHKVLTGRRAGMARLRMLGGVSGFPRRDESPYDTFGTGTFLDLDLRRAGHGHRRTGRGEQKHVVAVIGDGAMTAGMAFEALNNAGVADANLLVILNDNDMSISPPVGALNKYLARLLSATPSTPRAAPARRCSASRPRCWSSPSAPRSTLKGMITPGTLFEEFGFNYIGPIDGHDLDSLVPTCSNCRAEGPAVPPRDHQEGPGLQAGRGRPGALPRRVEVRSHRRHPDQGKGGGKLTYTQVFGDWLCDMARPTRASSAITPAMREGSGLVRFAEEFPERYFDVGIAEQHAVTFAAGLACEGFVPVVAIYSTFLQRAYDQLIHDVALQNLPVVFAIDRGGLVGADGATHHGAFDLSFLTCVPNMVVMAPSDEDECRQMLYTAVQHDGPSAVRYPRGHGPGAPGRRRCAPCRSARAKCAVRPRIALLAFGSLLGAAREVGETLDATRRQHALRQAARPRAGQPNSPPATTCW